MTTYPIETAPTGMAGMAGVDLGSRPVFGPGFGDVLPFLHIPHDERHGVTLYAERLARALAESGGGAESGTDVSGGLFGGARLPDRVHLHFTDRLWGADPVSAAAAVERVAERSAVTVTLHDLPQASDGARNLERRTEGYRRVVAAASGVVCNSRHEAALLARYTDASAGVEVIPLPVDPVGPVGASGLEPAGGGWRDRDRPAPANTVGLLGFVYPGKGHGRVIRAVGRLERAKRPLVEALGRASEGHERDLRELGLLARWGRVGFEVTGYLTDAELLERSRRTGVPVIAHQHVSASGSLASWLSAGRRPLVVRSPYMEEMAELHRNALTVIELHELGPAIARALADPASTWLDETSELGPTLADVAARYREFWSGVAW